MHKTIIAIVDSGISFMEPAFSITGTLNCITKREDTSLDLNGHGTMCAKTINFLNCNNEYYIIKCLDRNLKCSSEELLCALESLISIDVDIINLSLATKSKLYFKEFQDICEKLKNQGKIIVASVLKAEHYGIPANISSVIGVEGKYLGNHYEVHYNPEAEIQCIADSTPLIIKYNNSFSVFAGHSKATACLSGIISKKLCGIENKKTDTSIENSMVQEKYMEQGIEKLRKILINEIGDSYLSSTKNLLHSGINKWNISKILIEIEQVYGVVLPQVITLDCLESEKKIIKMIAKSNI